ncbi:MAG: 5-bromo-4-chloroindolyl phosphate hydrolysis family protein [Spirochaetota bacterium]
MQKHIQPGQILAGLVSGILFVLLFAVLQFALIITIVIAASAFGLMMLLAGQKTEEQKIEHLLGGIRNKDLKSILKSGHEKQLILTQLKDRIEKPEIRDRVDKIINVVNRIFDDLKHDPKDVRIARQFLNYYLDSTITIVQKYTDLSVHRGINSTDLSDTLTKTEDLLDKIYYAFEAQLAKLLEDDALDLDTEVALLEQTLKMEGLDR